MTQSVVITKSRLPVTSFCVERQHKTTAQRPGTSQKVINKFTTALQGDKQVGIRCACSDEEPGDSSCPQNVQLRWTTEVSSSIYATPLITDLYSDAHKDIIVPSFVHQVEVTAADLSTA